MRVHDAGDSYSYMIMTIQRLTRWYDLKVFTSRIPSKLTLKYIVSFLARCCMRPIVGCYYYAQVTAYA